MIKKFLRLFKSQKNDEEANLIRVISDPTEINSKLLKKYKRIIIQSNSEEEKIIKKIMLEFGLSSTHGIEYDVQLNIVNGIRYFDCRRHA